MGKKIGLMLIIGILGFVLVYFIVNLNIEEDWTSEPYHPGRKYMVTEVWKLTDTYEWVIFHQLNGDQKVTRSFLVSAWDNKFVASETTGTSSVEIGEKDPTTLTYNPKILKEKSAKDFEVFLAGHRTKGYLWGASIVIMIMLGTLFIKNKEL